jgi:hypothetical protein
MTAEWTIITTIAAIVSLFLAVGKPIIDLNSAITKLQTSLDALMAQVNEIKGDNKAEHATFDKRLDDHDKRITKLEGGKG